MDDDVIVDESMYDDLPPMEAIQNVKREESVAAQPAQPAPKQERVNGHIESNPTDSYAANLVNSEMHIKKQDDVIDLGPIIDEDEIYSTPRRDAEMDDFENYEPSAKERKIQKKYERIENKKNKKVKRSIR